MEVLSVKNLKFSYPNNGFSLKDISLSVDSGELVLIAGPCGCGKTTLLRLMKSEISPKGRTEGLINSKYDSCRIGYLFQNPEAGIVCQTVREELVFGAENLGLKRDEIKRSLAEISAYLGIEKYMDKRTQELSGGMKQIMNLASLLMMKPKVLLLDEPTKGLDPVAAADFFNLVHKLREELSVSIIVVEHNLENILGKASKVVYLENGCQSFTGTPKDFCEYLASSNRTYQETLPKTVKLAKGEPCFSVRELLERLDRSECERIVQNARELETNTPVASAKKGYFRYEKSGPDVIKDLSFTIEKGQIYGIVGGNGAGKSTLLSILLGYRKFYSGKLKRETKAALLPQNVSMIFSEDKLGTEYEKIAEQKTIKECLERYEFTKEIAGWLDKNPLDLSGGQMQKAGIFKLLLAGADIYLFDEPVNGLDGIEKRSFLEVIKALKASGNTVVMVSHDLEFVEEACDKVFFMFEGELLACDAPEVIFENNSFFTTVKGKIKGLLKDE